MRADNRSGGPRAAPTWNGAQAPFFMPGRATPGSRQSASAGKHRWRAGRFAPPAPCARHAP